MSTPAEVEALLVRLADGARRAATALDADDQVTFEAAVAECERLRTVLAPELAALAALAAQRASDAAMDAVRQRVLEAQAEHERLALRVARRRDEAAEALARLEQPDAVARAYEGAHPAPRLSVRR